MHCITQDGRHPHAQLSLFGYPPGPRVGDRVREAPGSLAEDLVFALTETGSYCREGSGPEHDLVGPPPHRVTGQRAYRVRQGRKQDTKERRGLQGSHSSAYCVSLPIP